MGQIPGKMLRDGTVDTLQLATGAVTEAKIGTGAVTETKIGTGAVTEAKIGNDQVTEAKINTGAVTEGKIGTGAVTNGKLGSEAVTPSKMDLTSQTYDFSSATLRAATPSNDSDVATKAYADSVAQGLDVKDSCRAIASSNITLSGEQTIDGVSVVDGDRVLCVGQSTASQNGIWVASTGAWARPTDFAAGSSAAGAFTFIEEGTSNADSGWVCTSDSPYDIVDTNDLAFSQFSGAGQVEAGAGLDKSGNTLFITELADSAIDVQTTGVKVNPDGSTLNITAGTPGTLKVADGGIGSTQLAGTSVIAAKLGNDVAGDGLKGGNGSALAVDVSDFAGTGLEDDGSENLRLAAQGNGISGGGGSTLSVDPHDDSSVFVGTSGVAAATPVKTAKALTAEVTSSDGDLACNTAIGTTPKGFKYVQVMVNGVQQVLGDSVKTTDCYFSGDGGANARQIANITLSDKLYWNGSVAGYELDANDVIDFNFVSTPAA